MKAQNLQVNHLTAPVGIGGSSLTATWYAEGGVKQTAFRVTVTLKNGTVIEDSGKLSSGRMLYRLQNAIPSRSSASLAVILWDENDIPGEAAKITVVTGIGKDEWKAIWIDPEESIRPKAAKPASYLYKKFTLDSLPADAAYLYVTAHGIVNVYLNGKECCGRQFMPGTNQVAKRLSVETVEVTELLRQGENEITVTVGNGWYRGSMGYGQDKNIFGTDACLLLQLEADGMVVAASDLSWVASQNGPIRENDMMDGEVYDATRENITDYHPVKAAAFGYENLIGTDNVPMLRQEFFKPVLLRTPKGEQVLDFGVNLVGYVEFRLTAKAGQHLKLTHGEVLDKDGNFSIKNFQHPKLAVKQEVIYTCRDGLNSYHPTKTYMGFRYALAEADFEIDPADFTGVAVYSDMRTTARFECGVPEVNTLFENALRSMKGNFVDVPTDCPTREKSGYSGDCQAYIQTAMYMMDCYPVYAKWIREQAATQFEDGMVAQVAPSCCKGKGRTDGGIGWSDSMEIVPYFLMERYNETTLPEEVYPVIKRWMEYQIRRAKKTRLCNRRLLPKELRQYMIDTGWMWGEWLEPDTDLRKYMKDIFLHGDPEVGTAYLYYGCRLTARMAERTGHPEDAAYFDGIAAKAKEAYRSMYVENGRIKEQKRQCRYVRPIFMGLLNEDEIPAAAQTLAEMIHACGDHLNTGFLTTHQLSRTLTRNGQNETAYALLVQREAPGWLYAVTKGCTTIPENWNCFDADGNPKDSFNHYSYGAVAGWLMDSCCGINLEYGKLTVAPAPDKRLGYANAEYDSPVGRIVSRWKYEDGGFRYHVEIPANCEAVIRLPGEAPRTVTAGIYDL